MHSMLPAPSAGRLSTHSLGRSSSSSAAQHHHSRALRFCSGALRHHTGVLQPQPPPTANRRSAANNQQHRSGLCVPNAAATLSFSSDGFFSQHNQAATGTTTGQPARQPDASTRTTSAAPAASHLETQQQQQGQSSTPPPAPQQPWRLLSSTPLAGGELQVVCWEGPRNIRIWLPPGYNKDAARHHPWPVLYCNDGQNLFGDCQTLSGHSWRAAQTAADLIASGALPPFLIVGLDHAGPLRSLEYTPYAPGTGPGGFRSDAAQWPGGGVAAYLARVQQEVLPWVAQQYGASLQPSDLALAGSSFGGVAALSAGMAGGGSAFGGLLVESPSMWIANEGFLKDVQSFRGAWPQRVYVGMGGREYSGVRSGRGREFDPLFPGYLKALYAALTEQGLGPDRLAWSYDQTAAHTEQAWAQRLPDAMRFVCQNFWEGWLRRQAAEGRRVCSAPGQLLSGAEGVAPGSQLLFFNRSRSSTLSHLPQGTGIKVSMGVDGWQQVQQLELKPLRGPGGRVLLHHHIEPPAQLQQEVFEQWGLEPALTDTLHQRLLNTVTSTTSSSTAATAAPAAGGDDWWVLQVPALPEWCNRLDMAFCDANGSVWDNNDKQDYCLSVVRPPPSTAQQSNGTAGLSRGAPIGGRSGGTVALAALDSSRSASNSNSSSRTADGAAGAVMKMLDGLRMCAIGDGCGFVSVQALDRAEQAVLHGANAPAQEEAAAAEASGQHMFTLPQQPVAGLPVSLYVNKARLPEVLMRAPSMCLQVGFNNWTQGVQKVPFRPTNLARNGNSDFWMCRLEVPPEATHGAYALCGVYNGSEHWDNNGGADYKLNLATLEVAVIRAVAGACIGLDVGAKQPMRAPRVDPYNQQAVPASKFVYA